MDFCFSGSDKYTTLRKLFGRQFGGMTIRPGFCHHQKVLIH